MLKPYAVTKDVLMAGHLITSVAGFFLTSMVVAALTSLDSPKRRVAVEAVRVQTPDERNQPRA